MSRSGRPPKIKVKPMTPGIPHAARLRAYITGDDVDLLKAMADEQKELAQAKFPKSVRRSSFDRNPNEAEALSGISFDDGEVKEGGDDNDKRVKRIHG